VREDAGRKWRDDPDLDYWHHRMRAKLIGFLKDPARVLDDLKGQPETEFTLYERAVALHRLPDPPGAIAAADRLIAMRPNDAYYHEIKAQILLEDGHATAAVPEYRTSVRLAPNEPLLKAELGRALLQLNDRAADGEALKVLEAARREDTADPAALFDLATAYDRAGDAGMATLATAERYALNNDKDNAISLARRASKILPEGSPGWLRAQDILKLDKNG
jgi:predicted Zn-dependent protease